MRRTRQEEAALLGAQCGGAVPDIDFHRMIRDFRQQCGSAAGIDPIDPDDPDGRICVCVRKRPIQPHEIQARELDCVTASNPFAIVHESKFKVDGITKCLESHQFEFDRVFDDEMTTVDVYRSVAQPLVPWVIENGGRATLFAYGQTGSGKTYTMTGIQRRLAEQLFDETRRCSETWEVSMSFFEIYGGRPYDLLNNRQRLETMEDAKNEVQIAGLTERSVDCAEAMLQLIELGNSLRTTHATAINRDSSRSHAVCAVMLRNPCAEGVCAKITLVDLAGSERAADSKSSIRQRRVEGAQINKSLLALKECIRAMGDPREAHVPFRASKLTLVLRDAFMSRCPSRTVMIACISPGITSADHSVNTLRYSDRLKDNPRNRGSTDDSALDGGVRRNVIVSMSRDAKHPASRPFARPRSPSPIKAVGELPASRVSTDLSSSRDRASSDLTSSRDREHLQSGKNSSAGCTRMSDATVTDKMASEVAQRLRDQSSMNPSVEPPPTVVTRSGDLRMQDNRYLHNTLTSEVFECGGLGVVDVGVQDLNDLAHMEALDEVRQWEDRIFQQHMVALQEDARLLTAESELLSQVQQGASYDIDWYVSEVDKVVRRKMQVYESFLDDLEAFKAHLRREERLSRSCQRGSSQNGQSDTDILDATDDGDASLQISQMVSTHSEVPQERSPHTPRSAGVAPGSRPVRDSLKSD